MELKIHFAILPTLGIPVERREPDGGGNREEKRTGRRKEPGREKNRTGEGTGKRKEPDGERNREEKRTGRRKEPGREKNRTEEGTGKRKEPDRAKNREAKRTGRFLG